ncbi:MAG: hypothetical protein FMNOHCHN_03950 [Ignavibacteriaceae bacterium]|nr:hypothetical protein [Ignavibacteriaceae bacterium]
MVQDVISQQKNERDRLLSAHFIPRDARLNLDSGLINVIIGPRRAGKSFFAVHTLNGSRFAYANFDDERLIATENYDEITDAIDRVYGNPEILLFDEIQNLQKWELFVNRLHRQGRKIVITGSNSNLLSGELATHLTGRNFPVYIFPFSFNELLNSSGTGESENAKTLFLDLLEKGGYPEVASGKAAGRDYLQMLFRDTIYKDIVTRYKPRDPAMISKLAELMIAGTGSPLSLRNLSAVTGYNQRTVSKFVLYILNTMIFFRVPRFSFKIKEQQISAGKTYLIDNGYLSSIGFNPSANQGKKLENLIASELYKNSHKTGMSLSYWKKDYECDFVLHQSGKVTEIIQASADLSNPKTLEREMRALITASEELQCNRLTIITTNEKSVRSFEWYGRKREITILPFTEWVSKINSLT